MKVEKYSFLNQVLHESFIQFVYLSDGLSGFLLKPIDF